MCQLNIIYSPCGTLSDNTITSLECMSTFTLSKGAQYDNVFPETVTHGHSNGTQFEGLLTKPNAPPIGSTAGA